MSSIYFIENFVFPSDKRSFADYDEGDEIKSKCKSRRRESYLFY